MKHNIRINGVAKEIDCELGSGILDKHGKEVFEGDTLTDEQGNEYVAHLVAVTQNPATAEWQFISSPSKLTLKEKNHD